MELKYIKTNVRLRQRLDRLGIPPEQNPNQILNDIHSPSSVNKIIASNSTHFPWSSKVKQGRPPCFRYDCRYFKFHLIELVETCMIFFWGLAGQTNMFTRISGAKKYKNSSRNISRHDAILHNIPGHTIACLQIYMPATPVSIRFGTTYSHKTGRSSRVIIY